MFTSIVLFLLEGKFILYITQKIQKNEVSLIHKMQ